MVYKSEIIFLQIKITKDPMVKTKRILFVCSGNRDRSPTAQEIFKRMLVERGYRASCLEDGPDLDFYVSSAGTYAISEGRQMTKDIGDQADIIFAMDEIIEERVLQDYSQPRDKVKRLDISDTFSFGEPMLIELLKKRLEPHLPI